MRTISLRWRAIAGGILATFLAAGTASAQQPLHLRLQTLDGAVVQTGEASGPRLLLLGVQHGDADRLDACRARLGLGLDDPSWIQAMFIQAPGFVQGRISQGLRKRYAEPRARAHVAAVFAAPDPALAAAGVKTAAAGAVWLDPEGRVIRQAPCAD